jgi:nucleoside phosphorylase
MDQPLASIPNALVVLMAIAEKVPPKHVEFLAHFDADYYHLKHDPEAAHLTVNRFLDDRYQARTTTIQELYDALVACEIDDAAKHLRSVAPKGSITNAPNPTVGGTLQRLKPTNFIVLTTQALAFPINVFVLSHQQAHRRLPAQHSSMDQVSTTDLTRWRVMGLSSVMIWNRNYSSNLHSLTSLACARICAVYGNINTGSGNQPFSGSTNPSSTTPSTTTPIVVCIMCAIQLEATAVEDIFTGKGFTFTEAFTSNQTHYRHATGKARFGNDVKVLLFTPARMGGIATAMLTDHVINEFNPRVVMMTGVCGGRRGEVHLGDLVVADRVFSLEGKATIGGMQYDIQTWQVQDQLLSVLETLNKNIAEWWTEARPTTMEFKMQTIERALFDANDQGVRAAQLKDACGCSDDNSMFQKLRTALIDSNRIEFRDGEFFLTEWRKSEIQHIVDLGDDFPESPLSQRAQAHIGPVAISPSGVRSDMTPEVWAEIVKFERKVLGVEMEGVGLFASGARHRTATVLFAKGVMDFADQYKDDSFKQYAARLSASWAWAFVDRYAHQAFTPSR